MERYVASPHVADSFVTRCLPCLDLPAPRKAIRDRTARQGKLAFERGVPCEHVEQGYYGVAVGSSMACCAANSNSDIPSPAGAFWRFFIALS